MATGGSREKLGYAFFIVNDGINGETFKGAEGSHADLDNFRAVFEVGLGFDWMNYRWLNKNVTLAQWDHTKDNQNEVADPEKCCIMCQIKRLDFTNVEYIMVGISSHGLDIQGNAVLQLFDGTFIYADDIMTALSDKKMPALKGKKRIIVVNSCRKDLSNEGRAADRGVSVDVDMSAAGVQPMDTGNMSSTQPLCRTIGATSTQKPPPHLRRLERRHSHYSTYLGQPDDFLIIHGAPPGRNAKTNSKDGSWLLCALRDVVIAHDFDRPLNLIQAITKANGIMSRRETLVRDQDGRIDPVESGQKNCLYFKSTLTSLPMITVRPTPEPMPDPTTALYSLEPTTTTVYSREATQESGHNELPRNYSLFGDDERDNSTPMDDTQPKQI